MYLRLTAALLIFLTHPLWASPTGPTIHLDYGRCGITNPLQNFTYFIPLIAPEHSMILTNLGNTQGTRMTGYSFRTNGSSFTMECDFEILGDGFQKNVFSHDHLIRLREKNLQAGESIKHALSSINLEGRGFGRMEIIGVFTNGTRSVNQISLHFNARNHASPVTVELTDLARSNNVIRQENEIVARVNSLTFHRGGGTPKMDVSLDSLKAKNAQDTPWQNFVGSIEGATANLFLPPVTIDEGGRQTMLDFGLALSKLQDGFTFPVATRLKEVKATNGIPTASR